MPRPLPMIDRARAAFELVHDDPAAAERAATSVLDSSADAEARQHAGWARGRARHERGRFADALVDLREAARVARARGDAVGAARIDSNRALTEYAVGDIDAARASLDAAEGHLGGGEAGHLHLQRAIIEVHIGELVQARDSFDSARGLLERSHNQPALLRCLTSRSVACTYLGAYDDAVEDLTTAIDLAVDIGQRLVAAGAMHNLGYVRARQGSTPQALSLFAEAAELYDAIDSPERVVAALEQDRAEVLLHAGLLTEAVAAARSAVARHEAAGAGTAADDARLLLADALLAGGDATAAADAAADLVARLKNAERLPLAAKAEGIEVRATIDAGGDELPVDRLVDRARSVHQALAAAGWHDDAALLTVDVGTALSERGGLAAWGPELEPLAATRDAGTAVDRIRAWHAHALLRIADGDRPAAMRAVRRGLRVADEYRRVLAGAEMRAAAANRSRALAQLGMRLAVAGGRVSTIFTWSEQTRARSLLDDLPDQPTDDTELRTLLEQLRAARARVDAAPSSIDDRQAAATLETKIRDHEHRRQPGAFRGATSTVDAATVRGLVGHGSLISFIELDGALCALAVTTPRVRRIDLGPIGPIADIVDRLRHAMTRMARGGSGPGIRSSVASFEHECSALDAALSLHRVPVGRIVVVPSPTLISVPWAAMPSLLGRPVTVTPSASVWARPSAAPAVGRPLFVAGPDLPGAHAEVRAAADVTGADDLSDDDATVEAVVRAFGERRLVHVAAHGMFRADAPLFSGVDLADGRLTLFDLRDVPRSPELVVLPACHLAATRVMAGGEPLGAIATLLNLGVRTVVAPIQAVADHPAAALMTQFHRELLKTDAATALGQVTAVALASNDPATAATAAAFVCSGRR